MIMDKIIRVLWVEDEAIVGLVERKVHLEMVEDFEITIVENASEAEQIILEKGEIFDAIVIDIRIPPGYNKEWTDIYNKPNDRLGIVLGQRIFDNYPFLKSRSGFATIERWKDIEPFFDDAHKIDPSVQYHHKVFSRTPEDFEQFIRQIS